MKPEYDLSDSSDSEDEETTKESVGPLERSMQTMSLASSANYPSMLKLELSISRKPIFTKQNQDSSF